MHIRHSNLYRTSLPTSHTHLLPTTPPPSPRPLKTQHKRSRNNHLPPPPHPSPHRILQRTRRGIHPDNFVIIYELMDEMMDFGYPQTTESKILQEYITQESHKLEIQARPPMAVTNAVSWRTEGIRYRKNEVFLDVIEV
ncbi:hypothetical protein CPB84DRAFT_829421 [Gymnopilus junonius]|uniref:Uncharacterized protein n=1 Tax=Gymnopilus junonius TaxID=109634 RepID=A0A9P5N8F9_GYMJU|nr:hypothetical protein CPB84DRAFT_829421 [Gymnopilus junonius]